jgi:hypothetical protein
LPSATPAPNGLSTGGPHTTVVVAPRLDPIAPGGESFRAALILASPALPMLATIIAVGLYIMPLNLAAPWLAWVKANPLLVAIAVSAVFGLIAGGVLAWVTRATSADQANASLFGQIEARYRELEAHINVLSRRTDFSPTEQASFDESIAYAELIHRELCTAGGRWVLGTGYVNVWNLIHRAEQSLLLVDTVENVVASAIYDDLRLSDSQITNSMDLRAKLRLAVSRLDPDAVAYFSTPPAQQPAAGAPPVTPVPPQTATSAAAARSALQQVRETIDTFRDQNWAALARTRNHLLGTITATGVVTFLILGIALAIGPAGPSNPFTDAIVAASTFYLVGAMVGLFNRLYIQSSSDDSVEDYGLSTTHLVLTPILSGLAALGGVLAVAMLPAIATTNVFTVSAAARGAAQAIPSLADIYSLQGNPFGIVFAAIFGLAPGLLLNSLQSVADKYRDNIKSTAPAAPTT